MAECIECGGYTKYKNGRCYSCHHKHNKSKTKEERPKKENNGRFPSHSELYMNLHEIEEEIVETLFDISILMESGKRPDEIKKKYTNKTLVKTEEDNWDIIIYLDYPCYKPKGKLMYKELKNNIFFIEYKSSINEWGKKFDDFLRQIKRRRGYGQGMTLLMSFDSEFDSYSKALLREGIYLLRLNERMLYNLRRKEGEPYKEGDSII